MIEARDEAVAATPAETGVRHSELRVLGLRTRVLQAGPADVNEAVVLVHGGARSADDWLDLLPRVGAFARAVAIDLPGFGAADEARDWSGFGTAGWAHYLTAVLDRLGIERAHLVLHDMGGEVGLGWAVAQPDRFASAVLINTGALRDFHWHLIARLHRIPVLGYLTALTGRLGIGIILRLYEPRLSAQQIRDWRAGYVWSARRSLWRYYRGTAASGLGRLAPELRELDRPALVIWGANNHFVPAVQAQRQLESFPHAHVHVLENSGHYTHLDSPDRVAELVLPFLRAATHS
ncbi:alpha/beta fold hydrolase [Nocardia sp. NPDC049526]|uniref:alpha/beta fold hydrolase n=1 Tax=Nocardia sp. NPDC049526 TaxID=3364316 RepID=UPI0037BCF2E6